MTMSPLAAFAWCCSVAIATAAALPPSAEPAAGPSTGGATDTTRASEGPTRAEAIAALCADLQARPQDGGLVAQLARAYYARGARNDAVIVTRLLGRLTGMGPEGERLAAAIVAEERPGRTERTLSLQELDVDARLRALLPESPGGGADATVTTSTAGAAIREGLARRGRRRRTASV